MQTTITLDDSYDGILLRIAHDADNATFMSIDAFDCEYIADDIASGRPVSRSNQTTLALMLAGF